MTAISAGLIAGVIFMVLPHAIPWVASGIVSPSVMGRDMSSPQGIYSVTGVTAALLHLGVSVLYAVILVPLVKRWPISGAVLTGGLVGFLLYLVNLLVFMLLIGSTSGGHELAVLVIHVAFGMAVAALYQGIARPRVRAA